MTRELLCAAANECCISAFEKVNPLAFNPDGEKDVLGP
jgi:hypothetical protein